MSNPDPAPFSMKDPPPCYMGVCVRCGLPGQGPDKMGECIVCYPCLNAEARTRLHKVEAERSRWYHAYRCEVDAYLTLFGRLRKAEKERDSLRKVLHHCACYITKYGGVYPVHLQEEIKAALGDFEMEKKGTTS